MGRTLEELIKDFKIVNDHLGEHIHIEFDEDVTEEETETIKEFVLANFMRMKEMGITREDGEWKR